MELSKKKDFFLLELKFFSPVTKQISMITGNDKSHKNPQSSTQNGNPSWQWGLKYTDCVTYRGVRSTLPQKGVYLVRH